MLALSGLIVFVFCILAAIGAGLYAAWSDFRSMTIPNLCSIVIAVAFVAAAGAEYMLAPGSIFETPARHLAAGVIVFAVTFVMFVLKALGGGDAKLLSAYALWSGMKGLMALVFSTACLGFLIALFAIVVKKGKLFATSSPESWIGRLLAGENRVPYGIAIAAGALFSFYTLGYFSPEKFSVFLEN